MKNQVAIVAPKTLTVAQIDDLILNIKQRGAKLDQSIQDCALSILLHIEKHGDITKANALYNAMPKGLRRNALVAWFLAFGKLKLATGKGKMESPLAFTKHKLTNIDGAMAKPWFECKKEAAPSLVFDLQGQLNNLLSRVEAAQKKGLKIDAGHVDIEKLKAMMA